jgi:hypothetical protein
VAPRKVVAIRTGRSSPSGGPPAGS